MKMRGRGAVHTIRRALPDPSQRRRAIRYARRACRALPILPPEVRWFREVACTGSGRGCPTGWFSTDRPGVIFLSVTIPDEQLREITFHECYHAAFPDDASERRPDRFAGGDLWPVLRRVPSVRIRL